MQRLIAPLSVFMCMSVAVCTSAAGAQSIHVGGLESAAPLQPGVLDAGNGGLDIGLWHGTSAELATYLIEKSPVETRSAISRDLLEAALLSSGVPPVADSGDGLPAYQRARLSALMKMGYVRAVQQLARDWQGVARDLSLMSDIYLVSGDFDSACRISDSLAEGRGESDWVALRGFCHVVRDEWPAADLAVDILKSRDDFNDQTYFSLMHYLSGTPGTPNLKALTGSPRHIALMNAAGLDWPDKAARPAIVAARLALDPAADPGERLSALWQAGPALSDSQIRTVLSSLAPEPETTESKGAAPGISQSIRDRSHDPEAVLQADVPGSMGRLFAILASGNPADHPDAIYEILSRAEANTAFERFAGMLSHDIAALPVHRQMQLDLPLFARAALERRDSGFFRQVVLALDGHNVPQQARIALAAAALGNGFPAGGLAADIDTRLAGDENSR
ncbi:MAG: hypothetical protein GDA39_03280, partial [Hyphomonadaceae bacterium]|nr:hypothetical protein [Hyphomonadaceae bacterium]